MKKAILILIPIILLAGFFLLKGNKASAIVETPSVLVETADVESVIYVNGTIVTEEIRTIKPADTTVVEKIVVKIGDVVKVGDKLAQMDNSDLNNQLLAKNIQMEIEQVKLSNMQEGSDLTLSNTLKQAKRSVDETKIAFESEKSLFEAGVISKQKYQASVNAYENAKTSYSNAQYSLQTSSRKSDQFIQLKNIETLENEIALLKEKIGNASVKSPIDGVVTEIKGIEGQVLTGSLMVVSNFDKNIIKANVSEADINKVVIGQTVTVTANSAKGQSYTGKVSFISPGSKNVDGKKQAYVGIKVELESLAPELRTNFSVKMKIITAFKADAKVVRFEAIKSRLNGEEYVTLEKADGTTEELTITSGISNDMYIEVLNDQLNVGDKILIEAPEIIEEQSGLF